MKISRLGIIGQGLIGSSITRAVHERQLPVSIKVTDASDAVRRRVRELGIGQAKVVETPQEAASNVDLVVICVPVGQIGAVARAIAGALDRNTIVSDVGSVKVSVVSEMVAAFAPGQPVVGAHPLAGTEFSGPDAGLPKLFVDRWCIITPHESCPGAAVAAVRDFWVALGSEVETMTPVRHDEVLSLTSHLPHLIAYSIFHTALRDEQEHNDEVIKFSAGGFRDFTRIASSSPAMWRDIFLANRGPVLKSLEEFGRDIERARKAISQGDGDALLDIFSTSRLARRSIIEREHISVRKPKEMPGDELRLARPYASDD
jgi:cyclohexadieny/prephenate dehydrogenase